MAGEGHSVERACRVLHVAESGYYAWRERAPSARTVRHAWLTEAILGIHAASRGTYGFRRVHAELALGLGIHVHHGAVLMLMRRAGLHGLPGNRTRRPRPETPSVADPVNRNFTRQARDQLWVTDITEHATLEGKVYCAVVLDTFSRRVVGWSIDASPNAALVTNALSMAISNRRPQPGSTIIHSDHGVHSSAPGPSRNGPAHLGCCPPWARSGTAWTSTCHHTAPLLLSGSL
ncbi:IS3 family transposase [Streptomyces sp. PSAA01]|nr:IS3 family transposase [Streptomyces sp. PSAA01]